jgi:hypothetical protein
MAERRQARAAVAGGRACGWRWRFLLPTVCLVLHLSCSPGPGEEEPKKDRKGWTLPSEIDVDVSADSFCGEYAKVACASLHECCPADVVARSEYDELLTSERTCRESIRLMCEDDLAIWLSGVRKGTVWFHESKAQSCLEELLPPSTPCYGFSAPGTYLPSCQNRPFKGLQTEGTTCPESIECAPGLLCDATGVCVSLPGEGAGCLSADSAPMCGAGLYCDEKGICRKWPREGESCAVGARCFGGLYCDRSEPGHAGLCVAKRQVGEGCRSDIECYSGLCNDECLGWIGEYRYWDMCYNEWYVVYGWLSEPVVPEGSGGEP